MSSEDDVTTAVPAVAGEFTLTKAEVSPGWDTIGGVPNGGYLLTVALRAAAGQLAGMLPLTVTGHFLRPGVHGPADLRVEIVKRGRTTSTVMVGLVQQGKERLRMLATFGVPQQQAGTPVFAPAAPAIPAPAECVEPPRGTAEALGATLADRFDYRVAPPSRWLNGEPGEPRLDAWIRLADGTDPDPTALVLFNDAFPAAVLELGDGLAPTVEITIHLRRPPAPGWIQARTGSRLLVGGLVEQDVELWDEKGELVAMSRQLMTYTPMGDLR